MCLAHRKIYSVTTSSVFCEHTVSSVCHLITCVMLQSFIADTSNPSAANVSVSLVLSFGSGTISPSTVSQYLPSYTSATSAVRLTNAGPGPIAFAVPTFAAYVVDRSGQREQWGTVTLPYTGVCHSVCGGSCFHHSSLFPPFVLLLLSMSCFQLRCRCVRQPSPVLLCRLLPPNFTG